jgi:hypothetical protein
LSQQLPISPLLQRIKTVESSGQVVQLASQESEQMHLKIEEEETNQEIIDSETEFFLEMPGILDGYLFGGQD